MADHPSVLGINSFSQQVVMDARESLDAIPDLPEHSVQSMRITLQSGAHYVARVVDVHHETDPALEREIVAQVVQSMIFRLRFRTNSPPAGWTWTFTRIEV